MKKIIQSLIEQGYSVITSEDKIIINKYRGLKSMVYDRRNESIITDGSLDSDIICLFIKLVNKLGPNK